MISHVRSFALALALASGLMVSGCLSTGNSFNTKEINQLVPGQTTLEQAAVILQGQPENVYRQSDGSATAYWRHKNSFVADAIYYTNELVLFFDANGYFKHVVSGSNFDPDTANQNAQPTTPVQPKYQPQPANLQLDNSNGSVQRFTIN